MPEQNNTEATIPKEIDTFCSVTSEFYDSMRGSSPISIMDLRFSENFVKVTLAAVKELGGEGEE